MWRLCNEKTEKTIFFRFYILNLINVGLSNKTEGPGNKSESRVNKHICNRYHSRFFDYLSHPNLSATLATDQKWPLSCLRIFYQSLAECHLL